MQIKIEKKNKLVNKFYATIYFYKINIYYISIKQNIISHTYKKTHY